MMAMLLARVPSTEAAICRCDVVVNGVGLEALLDIAELAMNIDIDIVAEGDALLFMQDRRSRLHGELRVEYRGQKLVLDLELPGSRPRQRPRSRPRPRPPAD